MLKLSYDDVLCMIVIARQLTLISVLQQQSHWFISIQGSIQSVGFVHAIN